MNKSRLKTLYKVLLESEPKNKTSTNIGRHMTYTNIVQAEIDEPVKNILSRKQQLDAIDLLKRTVGCIGDGSGASMIDDDIDVFLSSLNQLT